ncbi:hypothetical protein EJB05_45939, partial [Eragrostis curvula]
MVDWTTWGEKFEKFFLRFLAERRNHKNAVNLHQCVCVEDIKIAALTATELTPNNMLPDVPKLFDTNRFYEIITSSMDLELTDDREVHFKPYKLKELKAIHVRHMYVTDNQIKHVPVLP